MPHHDQTQHELLLNERQQIEYLMGNPPSWMMRYGISVVASTVFLLLSLSYFIQYPDVVEAKVMLTTANPPIRIIAQSSGQVAELLVSEKQEVKENEVLAVFENTANWRDVVSLEAWLKGKNILKDSLISGINIGELQPDFSVFSEHRKEYGYFEASNNTYHKVESLKSQIKHLYDLNDNLRKQKKISQREFQLTEKEFNRQGQLLRDHVIADKEYEATEMKWLQQKHQLESADATIIQNLLQIRGLEAEIIQVEQNHSDQQVEKERILQEDVRKLSSAIEIWKKNHLVIAPISGRVSLSKVWRSKQSIASGEEIMAVVPENNNTETVKEIIGKAAVPAEHSSKLKTGQVVIIYLDGFPAQEYGTVEAAISGISSIPQNETYLIDLRLSDSLVSNYNKTIPFRQEMTGKVKIITESRRVIERIFGKIRELLHQIK